MISEFERLKYEMHAKFQLELSIQAEMRGRKESEMQRIQKECEENSMKKNSRLQQNKDLIFRRQSELETMRTKYQNAVSEVSLRKSVLDQLCRERKLHKEEVAVGKASKWRSFVRIFVLNYVNPKF